MEKINESLLLSEEILADIELNRISFEQICLKVSRLGRLLGDSNVIKWIRFEINWYPVDSEWKFTKESYFIAGKYSGRSYFDNVNKGHYLFTETIPQIESTIESAKMELSVAVDPNVSVSSSNPNQHVYSPPWNWTRRIHLNKVIVQNSEKLAKLKHSIHKYVIETNYELKYWNTIYSIFDNLRENTLAKIWTVYPGWLEILSSIYDNLQSENKTDWSNAIHNCRRVLHELSNILYPPSDEEIDIGWWKKLKLNNEKYIARLKQYIKAKSSSETFTNIVWSSLEYIGDRLDAIYVSSTKWSHVLINNKEEAERYVIYTFILLSDILNL